MKLASWVIVAAFLMSSLYMFALFGLPLFGKYLPFPLVRESDPYSPWNLAAALHIIPFIGIFVSYLLYIFYSIISLYFSGRNFSKLFLRIYTPFEFAHSLTILLTIPFLFPLGFFIFSALVMKSLIAFGPMEIVLGVLIWILWFKHRKKIFSRIVIIVAMLIALLGVFYFAKESIKEFYPSVHGSFPLDDAKGVYLINYDGDYWLTYYIPEEYCWNKNDKNGNLTKVCKTNLLKHGNTAIVDAPSDLKKYLDKPVLVKGSFVPVIPPIQSGKNYRQFCITKPKKVCSDSKGPGIWYFSPLKIKSVKLIY
jgi:hypothetical protein